MKLYLYRSINKYKLLLLYIILYFDGYTESTIPFRFLYIVLTMSLLRKDNYAIILIIRHLLLAVAIVLLEYPSNIERTQASW